MRSIALALLLACGACAEVDQPITQAKACRVLLRLTRSATDSVRILQGTMGGYRCVQWIAAFPPVTPEANDAQK